MGIDRRQSSVAPATCGEGVVVVEPCNIYGSHLGDHVFVGPFCEIQQGVHVGPGTRIQSHSFLCELVDIGANCFIGHGVMFVNDLMRKGPARGDRSLWSGTEVGDNVSIGSGAVILPVSICGNTVIGAGSVVTRDIEEPGIYVGNPARRLSH